MKRVRLLIGLAGCAGLLWSSSVSGAQERSILRPAGTPSGPTAPTSTEPTPDNPAAAAAPSGDSPSPAADDTGAPAFSGPLNGDASDEVPTTEAPSTMPTAAGASIDVDPTLSADLDVPEVVTISIDDLDAPIPPLRPGHSTPIGTGVRRVVDPSNARTGSGVTRIASGADTAPPRRLPASASSRGNSGTAPRPLRDPQPSDRSLLPSNEGREAIPVETLDESTELAGESFAAAVAVVSVEGRGPAALKVGQSGRFAIEVSNLGDEPIGSAMLEVALPEHLRWLRSNVAGTASGRLVRFDLGTLGPQEKRSIAFDAQASKLGPIRVSARVITGSTLTIESSGVAGGSSAASPTATASRTSSSAPAARQTGMQVELLGPEAAAANQEGEFELLIVNPNETEASNIDVVVELPRGFRVTTLSNQASFDARTGRLRFVLSSLAAHDSMAFRFKAIATATGEQRIRAVVTPAGAEATSQAIAMQVLPSGSNRMANGNGR